MIKPPPIPFRGRKLRGPRSATPIPPAALTLVESSWAVDEDVRLRLTFDRAIDASGLDGAQITVGIADLGILWKATGLVIAIDPATIDVILVVFSGWMEPSTLLNASALSGIVAIDDGGTWAGVTDLALPFP
jgi:hypothetical protein